MLPVRVVVTGGREYSDRDAVFEVLDATHGLMPIAALAHGACSLRGKLRGADRWADEWCAARGIPCSHYPADWMRDGRRAAGPKRNRAMLLAFKPDVLIAFPGGDGTAGCVGFARAFGITVLDLRVLLGTCGSPYT
jgi:hypothetical protein